MIQKVRGIKFLKTPEGHNVTKGLVLTVSILMIFIYGYLVIIFYPVMDIVTKMHPKTINDSIIILSMTGFVALSLFAVTNVLPFWITRPLTRKLGWVENSLKPTLPKRLLTQSQGGKEE